MNVNQIKSLYYRQTVLSSLYLLRRKRSQINSDLANFIDGIYRHAIRGWTESDLSRDTISEAVKNARTDDTLISDMIARTIPMYRIVVAPFRSYNPSTPTSVLMSSIEFDMHDMLRTEVVRDLLAKWDPAMVLRTHGTFKRILDGRDGLCPQSDTSVGDVIDYLLTLLGQKVFDEIVAPMMVNRNVAVPYSVSVSAEYSNGGYPDDFNKMREIESKLNKNRSPVIMVTLGHDSSDDGIILKRFLKSLTDGDVLFLSFLRMLVERRNVIEHHSGTLEIGWSSGNNVGVQGREFDARSIYRSLASGSSAGFFVRLKNRRDMIVGAKKAKDRNVLFVDRTDVPTYGFEPFCADDNLDAQELMTLVKTRNVVYGPSLGLAERSPAARNEKRNNRIRSVLNGNFLTGNPDSKNVESVYTLDTELFNQFAWGPAYRSYGRSIFNPISTLTSGIREYNLNNLNSGDVKVIGSVSMISSVLLEESRHIQRNIKLASYGRQEIYEEWSRQLEIRKQYADLDSFLNDLAKVQGLREDAIDLSREKGYSVIKII